MKVNKFFNKMAKRKAKTIVSLLVASGIAEPKKKKSKEHKDKIDS